MLPISTQWIDEIEAVRNEGGGFDVTLSILAETKDGEKQSTILKFSNLSLDLTLYSSPFEEVKPKIVLE